MSIFPIFTALISRMVKRTVKYAVLLAVITIFFAISPKTPHANEALSQLLTTLSEEPDSITLAAYERALVNDPFDGLIFIRKSQENPEAFQAYLTFQLDTLKKASREGVDADQLTLQLTTRQSLYTELESLRLNDDDLLAYMLTRLGAVETMQNVNPEICTGSMAGLGLVPGERIEDILIETGLSLFFLIHDSDRESKPATLSTEEFTLITSDIANSLINKHGDAMGLFTGVIPLDRPRASAFCNVEVDYLRAIVNLPNGLAQRYYRNYTAFNLKEALGQ